MPMAARLTDMTSHSPPLNPGLGNLDVLIGGLPAWQALPGVRLRGDTRPCSLGVAVVQVHEPC